MKPVVNFGERIKQEVISTRYGNAEQKLIVQEDTHNPNSGFWVTSDGKFNSSTGLRYVILVHIDWEDNRMDINLVKAGYSRTATKTWKYPLNRDILATPTDFKIYLALCLSDKDIMAMYFGK
jgi:hypothetical protein